MRYLLSILAGTALALAAYLGLFLLSLGKPATESTILLLSKYRFKEAIARSVPSPRILIVSGSNGLYGINALSLEKAMGIPAVNFATQVQVSLDYLLDKAKQNLRPGDIVLLPLEFEFYWRQDETTAVFSDYVLGGDPAYFHSLPWQERLRITASASLADIIRRIILGPRNLRETDKMVSDMEKHMSDRGDLTGHRKSAQTPAQLAEVRASKPKITAFRWRRMQRPEFWRQMEAFGKWCREHDVLCIATFPSTIHFKEYETKESRATVDSMIAAYSERGIAVLGTPYDFMMSEENFHDSGYHLNLEASLIRTQRIADLLAPILEDWRLLPPSQ